jgi:HK97 family phage major capsid protein
LDATAFWHRSIKSDVVNNRDCDCEPLSAVKHLPGSSHAQSRFAFPLPGITGVAGMTKTEINERLKELATALEDASLVENPTDEQIAVIDQLDAEIDQLTAEKATIESQDRKTLLRDKAQGARDAAKASTRLTSPDPIGRIRPAVADDPKRGFKSFAAFATRLMDHQANVRSDEMLMNVAAGSGMSQVVNADGGVLVPPAFSKSIWDEVLRQSNSLLSYCYQLPIDPGAESVTVPCIAESSRANGSRYGGIQGYWKDELTVLTETKPTFRQIKLTPHELYVFAYISDKLLRHSPGTASAILERAAADEIAFKIGDAIINGTGAGQPMGIVTSPGKVSVAKETGQAAATVVLENLTKMLSAMHVNFRQGGVWFINPEVEPALQSLAFPVGTGGIPAYLPPGGLSESPYSMLFGKPVVPIEYCQALGTKGDIIYANLRGYAAAVRGMVDSQYSMHLKFDYAQTAFRMIFEMDGQPWLNTAITPFKGSRTTSPIVTLDNR